MFVWSGNFQGHVCAGRFTRPCIVHTEFWRLVIARWTRYNIMWSSLSVTCDRSVVVFSGSSANKTDRHDITEILLKVALNTINQTKPNHCCSTPNDYFFKLYPDENKFHSMGPCPLCTKTTPGCQVILYSYIFNILLYFLYLPKISYISSQNPIFFKTKREKSWIFYFEWKFHINMTNRCYTRY